MTMKRAEVLLGSGNYFHWEYNMRMTLARKGLLAHVQVVKRENEMTEAWRVNAAKALGVIAQGVEIQHPTKIRSATRAIQAGNTLREYYNRTTLHNRVTMTRHLHEFAMESGTAMAKHLDAFDELIVGLQTLGEPVDEARKNGSTESDAVFAVDEERFAGWLIDSGASSHMTSHREDLFEMEGTVPGMEVTIADGTKLPVVGRGMVKLAGIDGRRIMMMDVLYIPGLDRRAVALCKKVGKAYVLDCEQESARFVEYAGADSKWELWHARMGRPSENSTANAQRATNGLPTVACSIRTLCGGCMKGKHTVTPFPSRSVTKTSRVLELGHADVMGPVRTVSKGGAKYVLTFVDDYSRYVVAYFMKTKSEVANKLKGFKAFYENQWGERLKCLRSDNDTEFVNKTFTELCRRNGIMHQRTVPYSPQQNGVAERMNRTIMEKARSMLHYKGVSMEWWTEAVSTAVYLINRSTNTERSDVTPYEIGFKAKPRMEHLRVFCSPGYAHIDDGKSTKLDPKSFRCMLLGYAEKAKRYRVYDMDAAKVNVSRSMKLNEREMGGIYDSHSPHHGTVIHLTKGADAPTIPVASERQAVQDEPMEALPPSERLVAPGLELAEYRPPPQAFQDDRLIFRPKPVRSRRSQERLFLLENDDDERKSEDSDGPPTPKRPRIDDDGLIAVAVLAYAANVIDGQHTLRPWLAMKLQHGGTRWTQNSSRMNGTLRGRWFHVELILVQLAAGGCGADQCVYVKPSRNGFVYVCLYVDDMIIAAKTNGEIREVKDVLKNAFKMMELGTVKFILGMESDLDKDAGTLMTKQTRYIDDVVERFGQQAAKTVDNPCTSGLKLTKAQSPETDEKRAEMQSRPYRSLIGCLLYITTCTRPDIGFIVTQLPRLLENPGQQHWRAATRVQRYQKTAREHGIIYRRNNGDIKVVAYSDADWGTNIDDRRSVSGVNTWR
ncbi:unnamed protein product [Phytophthora fragariaefolia]|uniref:Unnamed protein product n=1 Tax=Phytophthora fragariaefolia TaxID=1490495 RepID=A0A9W6X8E9_9STRA|nr:unnamed protein product [Phytophthora fragariaefolia]